MPGPEIEADWQANLFFELRSDRGGGRSIEQMLEETERGYRKPPDATQ